MRISSHGMNTLVGRRLLKFGHANIWAMQINSLTLRKSYGKEEALMNCNTLAELLNVEFGEAGTFSREEFDKETEAFCLAQTIKEENEN